MLKYTWVNDYQALFVNNTHSIFKVNPDTENPKTRSLECVDIGSSNGLTAMGNNVIHEHTFSENGRFLAVTYRDSQNNELVEALEVFECKDAEFLTYKRIR